MTSAFFGKDSMMDMMGMRGVIRKPKRPVGPDGLPVNKTKDVFPFSYDPFVIYDTKVPAISGVDSDRLFMADPVKHDNLCRKHFGDVRQYWNSRDPALIQAFLRDFYEKPELVLVQIIETRNVANGFPLWSLMYAYDN